MRSYLRRTALATTLIVAVAAAAVGVTLVRDFEPFASNGRRGPEASTEAVLVDGMFLDHREILLLRPRQGARLYLAFDLTNVTSEPVDIVDLDGMARRWRRQIRECWRPSKVDLISTYDEDDNPATRPIPPPVTVDPLKGGVTLRVWGTMRAPGGDWGTKCEIDYDGAVSYEELAIPIRYRWLGVTRTQQLELDLQLAFAKNPGDWAKPDAHRICCD